MGSYKWGYTWVNYNCNPYQGIYNSIYNYHWRPEDHGRAETERGDAEFDPKERHTLTVPPDYYLCYQLGIPHGA